MTDPIIQFSECGGELVKVTVPGAVAYVPNPENEVEAAAGVERTMCVYVPASGCPHPKQTQVLYVLRDDSDLAGARRVLDELGLTVLAEREHAIVVFPDPVGEGWNYAQDPARDDDTQFIARCFGVLKPTMGVSGFNGMMFHIGTTPASSAMVWTLALTHPLDSAAVMVGEFPEGYEPPQGYGAEQVAWVYGGNTTAAACLAGVNGPEGAVSEEGGVTRHAQAANPCVAYHVSDAPLSADEVASAWAHMFAGARRWRNDDYGIYQPRIDFAGRGFVAHVSDGSLGLPDGLARTWYEYVPPALRDTTDPVPLVLYFHGINCCGLYGAEQSGWADVADREGFAVVFPDATIEMRWNVWDDPRLPSDVAFVRALIDHMDEVHPVDRSRIYLSGFSMGSMFSNALACSYPELFAGVVACNGPHQGYLSNLDDSVPGMLLFNRASVLAGLPAGDGAPSPTHKLADQKRASGAVRMPFVQFVGLADNVGFEKGRLWPVTADADGQWGPTVAYWKRFNNIPVEPLYGDTVTGFAADREVVEGADERFVHQAWRTADEGADELYHLVAVKRMPHAVDLRQTQMGWNIVKHYTREKDGALVRLD